MAHEIAKIKAMKTFVRLLCNTILTPFFDRIVDVLLQFVWPTKSRNKPRSAVPSIHKWGYKNASTNLMYERIYNYYVSTASLYVDLYE